ncbi:acyltransferase family protein [Prevotella dentasini]|uniref:acyltransferase family protein n=1 Tax=Prevotella dentasini TaxID=589537 RepID=UPI00046A3714|nr:acyltransferase family protein [Prevotella dentasini]
MTTSDRIHETALATCPPRRQHWIDLLRGFCMLAILLDHTEIYYTGDNLISYHLYVADALVVFFFISGYLFCRPNNYGAEAASTLKGRQAGDPDSRGGDVQTDRLPLRLAEEPFPLRHKLLSIIRNLLVPYFVFTTALALPKSLAHGLPVEEVFLTVLTGQASWFIAALIVGETAFALLLWISREKWWILSVSALLSMGLCIWSAHNGRSFYWQADNACMALTILYLGYLYRRKEAFFNRFHTPYHTFLFFILFIIIKVYVHTEGVSLLIEPIGVSDWPVFVVNMVVAVFFLVNLFRQIPRLHFLRPVEWTGSHSLVYYFLCGGVPLTVSAMFQRLGLPYDGNYLHVVLAYVAVWIASTVLVWLTYRYLPFAVGRWDRYRNE